LEGDARRSTRREVRVLPLPQRRAIRAGLDAALNTAATRAWVVRLHCSPPRKTNRSRIEPVSKTVRAPPRA
jgi:hypothetical protein